MDVSHLLHRQKSTPSSRRNGSEPSLGTSVTPSDPTSRGEKSAPYKNPQYEKFLNDKAASYMKEHNLGIADESESLCQTLLEKGSGWMAPENTLFRDSIFSKTCQNLQRKNEARVVQDIGRLLVPSAETLATLGAHHLDILVESVNEGWNNSIPVTIPRPQPDYAVGFDESAFSKEQLSKLQLMLGDAFSSSYFKATWYMLFPFLTSEVKCGAAAFDLADRQNAHSMTLGVRAVVDLFKLAKREKELHRQVVDFSVSHNHEYVKIYGYYPVIEDVETTIWRHPIHKFDITAQKGKEKWTTHVFTTNVYNTWMPSHLRQISSVIDAIPPSVNLELDRILETRNSESTGLSQGLRTQFLLHDTETGSEQASDADMQSIPPSTQKEKRAGKKRKRRSQTLGSVARRLFT
ncbi:hypothetical protein MMC12_008057 [Toensbergia leucococca]|nr:hypothetical protein [Toensbergia leucococca]